MNKYLNFVREFHNNNQNEIDFINNQLSKYLKENEESQTEIEHILDFLYSTQKTFNNIGYKTILEKAEKWNKKFQNVSSKIDEKEGEDIKTIKEWEKEGFKFVKLVSEPAYKREGKLMSHCVASYYGKDVDIYSLRDKNNNPHCTIEKNMQIKGKGNGKIHPDYIKYVVEFLEELGMEVRDSEMENLGYIVPMFHEYVENKLYRGKYFYKNSKEKIVYNSRYLIVSDINQVNIKTNKKILLDGDITCSNHKEYLNLYAISRRIVVYKNAKLSVPNLKTSGYIIVYENAKLSLPNLKTSGDIDTYKDAKLSAPNLKTSGNIYIYTNAKLSLPNLKTSGDIDTYKDTKLSVPNLNTSGDIYIYETAKLSVPNLKTSGYIYTHENAKLSAPNLKTSGHIHIRENAKLSAPNLKTSGDIYIYENAKLSLPKLKTSGDISIRKNAELLAPNLKGNIK